MAHCECLYRVEIRVEADKIIVHPPICLSQIEEELKSRWFQNDYKMCGQVLRT